MKQPVKQVLGDKILLKVDEIEEKITKGGIIIPDLLQEAPPTGIIVSVGNKVESLKVGDHVRFNKGNCMEVEIDYVKYQLLKSEDVFFILDEINNIKQLTGNKIALKLDSPEVATKAGIITNDEYITKDKHPHIRGTVVAIGPKVENVKVGNKVQFAKHCGREVEVLGEHLHFLTELDIHLILN